MRGLREYFVVTVIKKEMATNESKGIELKSYYVKLCGKINIRNEIDS